MLFEAQNMNSASENPAHAKQLCPEAERVGSAVCLVLEISYQVSKPLSQPSHLSISCLHPAPSLQPAYLVYGIGGVES